MTGVTFDLDRAVDFLERERHSYLADLETLVSIDSGTFDKAGVDSVVDQLEQWYRQLGGSIERLRNDAFGDHLVVRFRGPGRRSVLLLGHTDTVYATGVARERPMHVEGARVVGPGTADMKAGDLSILYALRAILDQGTGHLGELIVFHNSDEEIGSPSSRDLISRYSERADGVLVLEAGRENGDVVVARKGIVDIEVRVTGRSAHAGVNHDQGRSAILALARLISEFESLNGRWPDVTVNVGMVEGGERVNVVPDRAYARMEVRAFQRDVLEQAVERVREIAAAPAVDATHVELRTSVEHWPMHRSAGGDRLLRLAQDLAEKIGVTFGGASTGGASDGNTAAAAGRPVLDGLGPVGGKAHSLGEYIALDSIVPRTAILAGLMTCVGNPALHDAVST
jgi:glutamate carboxypeptidase